MLSRFRIAIMYFTHVHTGTMVMHWPVAQHRGRTKLERLECSSKRRDLRECERTLDVRETEDDTERAAMVMHWPAARE